MADDNLVLDTGVHPEGPHSGGQVTTSGSWQYIDLRTIVGKYAEVCAWDESAWVCFVSSSSVTPTITNQTFPTANVARVLPADQTIHRLVKGDTPVLAVLQNSGAGTVQAFES